jgi:hypothetical protein
VEFTGRLGPPVRPDAAGKTCSVGPVEQHVGDLGGEPERDRRLLGELPGHAQHACA